MKIVRFKIVFVYLDNYKYLQSVSGAYEKAVTPDILHFHSGHIFN